MDRGLHIGLDPGVSQRTAFAIVDGLGNFVDAGFFEGPLPSGLTRRIAERLAAGDAVSVAIDGPRHCLPAPRAWDWDAEALRWIKLPRGIDAGRHAEIILRAHGFREGRWTGLETATGAREQSSMRLFAACAALNGLAVHEVCAEVAAQLFDPPATREEAAAHPEANLTDATLAVTTLREFLRGRGLETGGGDGLGSILLPRPLLPLISGVLTWPEETVNSSA